MSSLLTVNSPIEFTEASPVVVGVHSEDCLLSQSIFSGFVMTRQTYTERHDKDRGSALDGCSDISLGCKS